MGPVMMYGPGCDHAAAADEVVPRTRSDEVVPRRHPLDTAVIGLAVPANASDPFLTNWTRSDKNPVHFAPGSPPCAFAGRKHLDAHPGRSNPPPSGENT